MTILRSSRDPHEKADSEAPGSILFGAFGLCGCAYIIVAKSYAIPPVAVTIVPIAIMTAYALVVSFVGRLALRQDQLGDNLYYMGFTFTLTSLGVSLYQYSSDGAVDEIVRNFGVAVGSTIAGVVMRVFFHQMRRDPVDVEETTRLELSDASRRARREIEDAILEFSHFRRASQQAFTEMAEEVAKGVQTSTQAIVDALKAQAEIAARPLDEAASRSREQLALSRETAGAALDSAAAQLSTSIAAASDRLDDLTRRIELTADGWKGIESPQGLVEISVQPLADDLRHSVDALERAVADQAASVRVLADMVGRHDRPVALRPTEAPTSEVTTERLETGPISPVSAAGFRRR